MTTVAELVSGAIPSLYKEVYLHFADHNQNKVFLYRNTAKQKHWCIRYPKLDAKPTLVPLLDQWAVNVGLYRRCWTPWVKAIVLDTLCFWRKQNFNGKNPQWWFEFKTRVGKEDFFTFELSKPSESKSEQKLLESFCSALEIYITEIAPPGHQPWQRPVSQEHMRWFVRNWVLGESQNTIKKSAGKEVNLPIRDVALSLRLA